MFDEHEQTGETWGTYRAAVERWARVIGRPAPVPIIPGKGVDPVVNPQLVEWMMGLPLGYVTDVPGLTRNQQLHALGNGVVPQQAAYALRLLLDDHQAATVGG